jgi:ferredoxin
MTTYIITSEQLAAWLQAIIESGKRVLAPVTLDGITDFRVIRRAEEVAKEDVMQTRQSAKQAAFPRVDTLFSYRKEENDTQLTQPDEDGYPETVVWHARPCDVQGFAPLSAIMNWEYKDNLYNTRLARTTLVAFACTQADAYCFCTSVGGAPDRADGADILVKTLTNGNYQVEVLTGAGSALTILPDGYRVGMNNLPTAGAVRQEVSADTALADVPQRFAAEDVRQHLQSAFDSPIWKQQSLRCLGCGACAYVCPTCACFDIQEDAHGKAGRRLRCWDSCGFGLFTQHTSGHNPRPSQATRWRQRLLHKFSYMPDRLSVFGCTGCGRCSRACPVDMNLAEHLTAIGT